MRLILITTILLLASPFGCSGVQNSKGGAMRTPSAEDVSPDLKGDSCAELVGPLLDSSFVLKKEDYNPDFLQDKELLELDQYHAYKEDEQWQRFISRADQSEEEREMAYVILSMLRKRFPSISDSRLKDRYKVFMAFCGV